MFGVNVIAERAIADQGIMILGAETLDANFTQTTEQNFISPASLDIIGNSEFSAFAAGTASGVVTVDANFSQSLDATRVRQTDADMIPQFDQTSTARWWLLVYLSSRLTLRRPPTQNFIASGVSEQSGTFTQTSDGNLIAKGLSTQIGDSVETAAANIVQRS